MFFESHAHYDDAAFDEDREVLLKELKSKGVDYIINAAADIESSEKGIELSKRYDFIYCSVGVHPHEVKILTQENYQQLKEVTSYEKVRAIGEIGLDYYYDHSPRDFQKYWFEKQIQWAKEVDLPIIVHSREAAQDTFDIIERTNARKGVIHCYSGSVEMALEYVKRGFYIGIGGTVTFKKAKKVIEVAKAIPLSSILIETDSPYLAPVPNRGKRNDSSNLCYITNKIADIKDIPVENVEKITWTNGKKLFSIE